MKKYKNGNITLTQEELRDMIAQAVEQALKQESTEAGFQKETEKKSKQKAEAKPQKSKKGIIPDWASLPERKTLNRNQVAHRAICKALGKGYSKADYDAMWNSWKEFRDQ